jgi:methyl-accepting chemotaxis protein
MSRHEQLIELANRAVDNLFGDLSVSKSETRDSLGEVKDNIESMIEYLTEDIQNEAEKDDY